MAGRPHDNIAAVDRVGRPFELREGIDLDGTLRLTVLGGLDIVVADRLTARLQTLRASARSVRLDLSELEFIDCTGLEAIIDELTAARRLGRSLEVDRPVSAPVKRVITFQDASSLLWPADGDDLRPALRVIDGPTYGDSDSAAPVARGERPAGAATCRQRFGGRPSGRPARP
jgi:anti-anti-sigma factor